VVEQIELRLAASKDGLTGAMQRMAFLNEASRDFARGRRSGAPIACLLLDADRFKTINDTFGHATGDDVLRHVVSQCLGALRESDYVGRLGGEEFCVMLPETMPEDALGVAERIRQKVGETPAISGRHAIGVTVSIGIAGALPADGAVLDMIKRADRAMYEAKSAGRNRSRIATS
ncbi:MAG: GGDEF domain-containing protein, partial [Rhizobiales bacterium]|nr:GGDEF domain-containing protein [Hyphomicrobiales bacterium]